MLWHGRLPHPPFKRTPTLLFFDKVHEFRYLTSLYSLKRCNKKNYVCCCRIPVVRSWIFSFFVFLSFFSIASYLLFMLWLRITKTVCQTKQVCVENLQIVLERRFFFSLLVFR
jgi:hypothetical protein